jgi:transcriptional regulator with XRE-family HTH domain
MPRRPSTHVDSPAAVGSRVAGARKAAGLTQRQLAFAGCTAAYISRIEAGARIPSYQILREFANRLGVSADYLATGVEETDEPDILFEAEVALRLDKLEQAEQLYERVREDPDSDAVAVACAEAGFGQVALRRGETSEAIERFETAFATDLPTLKASAVAEALGRAYAFQGRFADAFDLFGRYLEAAKVRNDRVEVLRFSVLLANALIDNNRFSRAEELLGDAVDLARQSLDPKLKADLYWSQSRLYSSEGNPDLAARYAQLTISTLEDTEHTVEAARALLLLAHIENDRGNSAAAVDLVDEGEPVVRAAGSPIDRAMFALERARGLEALGEAEEAASLVLGSVAAFAEASPITAARGYAAAARFFQSHGDDARALELYELAADRFPAPDRHLADVLTAMAEIEEARGNTAEALSLLKSALAARSGVSADDA